MNIDVKKNGNPTLPKLIYLELSSCDGCGMKVVNLDGTLLDLIRVVDLKQMRIAMTGVYSGHVDVALIEGAVSCEEEEEELRELRGRTSYLIAIGACAELGGIPGMAPSCAVKKAQDGMFGAHVKAQGPFAPRPIHEVVRVDAVIHGCPPTTDDIVRALQIILAGGRPDYSDRPVCAECVLQDNDCLLTEGRACLGPVIRAGCNAVCLNFGGFCWGCRGLLQDAPIGALYNIAETNNILRSEIDRKLRMANARHFNLIQEG
jgi:coenzyme F420-reducing hydrogenase gamma subunit